jgi:hypothetical protein
MQRNQNIRVCKISVEIFIMHSLKNYYYFQMPIIKTISLFIFKFVSFTRDNLQYQINELFNKKSNSVYKL